MSRAVLPSLPRLWQRLQTVLGALLLAAACLQAVGPWDAPLERSHGSAFSAETEEVALAPTRWAEIARAAVPLAPLLPVLLPVLLIAAFALVPMRMPARAVPRPRATSPPVRPYLRFHPGRRAPPRP